MNRQQREAIATFPRAQSVRLLYVAKRARDARRERIARAAFILLGAAAPLAIFVMATGGL